MCLSQQPAAMCLPVGDRSGFFRRVLPSLPSGRPLNPQPAQRWPLSPLPVIPVQRVHFGTLSSRVCHPQASKARSLVSNFKSRFLAKAGAGFGVPSCSPTPGTQLGLMSCFA